MCKYNYFFMINKEIRWKQRFQNFTKALYQLEEGVSIHNPSELEKQGVIQRFEFTFELSWKVIKDYLESKGLDIQFPRDVIKNAYQTNIIQYGQEWITMLEKRNLLSHTYDERVAEEAYSNICAKYYILIKDLHNFLSKQL